MASQPGVSVVYVTGAERMMTRVWIEPEGIGVSFADGKEGLIPWRELALEGAAERVSLPDPYGILLYRSSGQVEEVPWDYARHFVDASYQEESRRALERGLQQLGERLRRLREAAGLSQQALSASSGVSRVTIARIETGEQSPRYETLLALAKGLGVPVERLLTNGGPADLAQLPES